MKTRLAVACVALAAAPLAAPRAQEWRTLEVSRQVRDSLPLRVRVTYGAGELGLRRASSSLLYEMRVRYNAERAEPVHAFDSAARTLRLGVQRASSRGEGDRDQAGTLQLALSNRVPLDLTLDLGAVEADLDLGGLRLSRLKVESGASDARIRFDTSNEVPMETLDLDVGVASLRAANLANANAREVRVNARVGAVDLDFGGEWTQDVELRVEVALGGVTLRVPPDVGVKVDMQKFLTSFANAGLVKRGNAWYSSNWDTATHKLSVSAETAVGRFTIDRGGISAR